MSKIDALLITPPSRLEVYQGLSNEYAAIEQPVWSSLTATYLMNRNYDVQILDAEAENLSHNQTAEKILSINPRLAIFMIYGQQPSASTQNMTTAKEICSKFNSQACFTVDLRFILISILSGNMLREISFQRRSGAFP